MILAVALTIAAWAAVERELETSPAMVSVEVNAMSGLL